MNKTADKNAPENLQGKVNSARVNVFLMVFFTVINLVLLLTEANRYFLFSAAVPYVLTLNGAAMSILECGAVMGTYTVIALVLSVVVLAFYVACMLLTKKRNAWFVVAAVAFALDTALLVYWNSYKISEILLDLVFHAWVLYSIISGCVSANKLKKLRAEAAQQKQQLGDAVNSVFSTPEAE